MQVSDVFTTFELSLINLRCKFFYHEGAIDFNRTIKPQVGKRIRVPIVARSDTCCVSRPRGEPPLTKACQYFRKAFGALLCSSFNMEMMSSADKSAHITAATAAVVYKKAVASCFFGHS